MTLTLCVCVCSYSELTHKDESYIFEPSLIPLIYLMFPSSSHNWNTLFLGTSAVADAIAEKYNTTKSKVLDHVSNAVCSSSTRMLPITCSSTPAFRPKTFLH